MAWTPTSLVRRSPRARDPHAATEAGTRRPIGPRRAAREAWEAEETAQEKDRAIKRALVRQVRYFSEFSAGERKALCGAMHRVDARAGERVMTHLPRLERESHADSAAGKTSTWTFHRSLLRAKKAKAKVAKRTKTEETAFTAQRRDDAWYVVAAGAVDVYVSVPGDALADNTPPSLGDAASASSRFASRLKWRGLFSKAKRLRKNHRDRNGSPAGPRLPPRTATLRAGSFFGALDDAFAADPEATIVFVAAETPTVLFAVPGERFPGSARRSELDRTFGDAEADPPRRDEGEAEEDASSTSARRNARRFASAATKVAAFHRRCAPLFDRLPAISVALTPFQRALLLGSATTTRSFRPFERIEREADPGDACWVVADGEARATASTAGFDTGPKTEPEPADAIDAEVWKRAFAVGEGVGEACLSFARPARSLSWETNLRAGADGAEAVRVDGDAFRALFRGCAATVAAFEALVEASTDEHALGSSGSVAPTRASDVEPKSASARKSDDGALSTPRGLARLSLSGRASSASDASASIRDPEAFPTRADAFDASPSTPPTPSPRRPDARRERRAPPLVAVPRKRPRRRPKARRFADAASSPSPERETDALSVVGDDRAFPEEWETDSDEERRAIEARRAKGAERAALHAPKTLSRGAAESATSTDASSALVAAFARARLCAGTQAACDVSGGNVEPERRRFDANKPLRRRAPLGPPPLGVERVARLLACLETHPPFRGVEMRALREAARDLELKILRPGETLYARGSETRDYAYVVEAGELEGRACSSAPSESRAAARAVRTAPEAVFRSGDVFGDAELTFGVPREHSVVAGARGAKVWGMRKRWFERLRAPRVIRRRDVFRDVVRSSPLLASLPFAEQRDLAALLAELGEPFRVDAGETAVAQDRAPTRVFFVTSGTADALVATPELVRPLVVGTFTRGDAFGHLEFFLEEERESSRAGGGDDSDLRETRAVANRASVVASTRLRGVAVDGFAFRAVASSGTALRRALDTQRAAFANGVV